MKKNRILIFPFMIMGMLFMLLFSCKKDESSSVKVPVLTTNVITDLSGMTATCGGNIISDGGSTVTARGVCWSLGQTPTIADSKTTDGTGAGNFVSSITDLIPNTDYYARAYATNVAGTAYGSAMSFTTIAVYEPILTTFVSYVSQTTATCGGEITSDGNSQIIQRGVCWSTEQSPTIDDSKTIDGTGTGSFTSAITNLNPNTTYFVRAYAINGYFTSYGIELSFTTNGTITDIDGNVYNTITIGTQVWLVENLKTTKYRNGDPIPNVTGEWDWNQQTTGAYCDYNNTPSNSETYGRLYNWHAVNDSRNIAPEGWHVPADDEWSILISYMEGYGGKLKEAGTSHWQAPNSGATNASGFTALPGGSRDYVGQFDYLGKRGHWWSSTQPDIQNVKTLLHLDYDSPAVGYYYYAGVLLGCSVRCVKD